MLQKRSKTNILSAFSSERLVLAEEIYQELAPLLNKIHHTSYSFRFWKLVLAPHVNTTISKIGHLTKEIVQTSPFFEPINGFEFPGFRERMRVKLFKIAKYILNLKEQNKLKKVLSQEDSLTLHFPSTSIVERELGISLPPQYFNPFRYEKGNARKREKVAEAAKQADTAFKSNTINLLPTCLVEHFDSLIATIPLIEPENKTFHIQGIGSLYERYLLAKYIEQGARLIWYQHGAYYGELAGHNAYAYESSLADEYRTWGWKIQEGDVPWKSYRLIKFKEDYSKIAEGPKFDYLFCLPNVSTPSAHERCVQDVEILMNNLANMQGVLARARPMSLGQALNLDYSFLEHPKIKVDKGRRGSMGYAMAQVNLVVQFTIPSTNFFECLCVDKPVIGLLHNTQPTSIIEPYYDFFKEVGILHENMKALGQYLNKLEDVDSWWKKIIETKKYQDFKEKFLRTR